MSGARTSPSPTRMAWAPASTTRSTSAAVAIPLSLTATRPAGTRGSRSREGARLVLSVCRSRLLTPTTGAPSSMASSSSSAVWISTSVPSPIPVAARSRSASRARSRAAAIRSTASAPAQRDSQSWYSSTMNSFLRTGIPTAVRTVTRSSRWPRKYLASVSTEMAAAPARSYARAWASGSSVAASTPWDGEAFLTSAIRRTRCSPRGRRAASNPLAGPRPRQLRHELRRGVLRLSLRDFGPLVGEDLVENSHPLSQSKGASTALFEHPQGSCCAGKPRAESGASSGRRSVKHPMGSHSDRLPDDAERNWAARPDASPDNKVAPAKRALERDCPYTHGQHGQQWGASAAGASNRREDPARGWTGSRSAPSARARTRAGCEAAGDRARGGPG